MKTLIIILAFAFNVSAEARDRIVLFKPTAEVQRLLRGPAQNRANFEITLRKANQTSLSNLSSTFPQIRKTFKKDLWLIQGALIDLSDDEAVKMASDANVYSIRENRKSQFVEPMRAKLVSRDTVDPAKLWNLPLIKVQELREAYPNLFMGQGVTVGVLDTGIQSKHPEFKEVKSVLFKDFINLIADPYDDHGHGTHVSGTIAGVKTGIAPRVSLVVGKIFDANGSGDEATIFEGMQWIFDPDNNPATMDQPKVVNNSWGMELDESLNNLDDYVAYRRALSAWISGGIVPVFAAGNSSGAPNGIPAGLPEAIAVGAVDQTGTYASFSSRGPNLWKDISGFTFSVGKPDLCAPGNKITSAAPGNKYAEMSGTSMATPHVTALAALALQVEPNATAFRIHNLLITSTDKKPQPNQYGYGMVNALTLIKTMMQQRRQ